MGVDMEFKLKFMMCMIPMLVSQIYAQPVIRSIQNKTPFQFTIVGHNDVSDCSPFHAGKVIKIEPNTTSNQQLLLGSDKPGLLLRPSGFLDKTSSTMYSFLDEHDQIDQKRLAQAFDAWEKSRGKKYEKGASSWNKHINKKYKRDSDDWKKLQNALHEKRVNRWFAQWLCGDISLIHNHVEVFGYLLNISIARIDNEKNYHACMVDYSEGLFSRQVIDIIIEQHPNKGIIPHVKSFVGQGGLCQDGKIVSM